MYDDLACNVDNEPYWEFFKLISSINRQVRRASEQALKSLSITWSQFEVLSQLSLEDNLSQTELAERLDKDATNIMVLCDSLEKKGLVNRVKDLEDRRVNRIVLSANSKTVTIEAYKTLNTLYKSMTANISQQTLEKFLYEFEKICESLQQQSEEGSN